MLGSTFVNAINNIWPMLIIFLVVLIVVRIFYYICNSKDFVLYKELIYLCFLVYALLLFELVTDTELSSNGGINLVPFTEIFRYKIGSRLFLQNVVGNIVIFMPFGYFISSYIKSKKMFSIFIITVITSTTIELVQHKIGRSLDVDDIILNVLGGIFGFLIYIGLNAIKKYLPSFLQREFFYNILTLLIIAFIIFYCVRFLGMGW